VTGPFGPLVCSYLQFMLYSFAVNKFYYTKLIISNLKNTEPMILTTNVAYMPPPDTNFERYL